MSENCDCCKTNSRSHDREFCYGRQVGNSRQLMPEGFHLLRLDDHYHWYNLKTERESDWCHWDRWALRRAAFEYSKSLETLDHQKSNSGKEEDE